MSKKNAPYGVLVYDRFFKDKPKAALLLLKKTLWCCALVFCGLMFLLTEYELPLRVWLVAAVGVAAAAVFSAAFALVKRRIVLPIVAAGCAWAAIVNADELRGRLTYFADALMLSAKGRFFSPEDFLFHDIQTLVQTNADYVCAVEFCFAVLGALYGLVCAAAFARRPRFVPSIAALAAMAVPLFVAENMEFNAWLIPFAALSLGAWAVGVCFRAGLVAQQGSGTDYRSAAVFEDREFRRGLKRADYPKRVSMSAVYYSKYFSVGMYCAALFAAAGLVSSAAFGKGSSIDYSKIYEIVTDFGADAGISSSPFESGAVSEYFTDRRRQSDSRLNVTTPSTGNEEIIRVTLGGDCTVYLRGDIGVDFNGTSWTSPVNNALKSTTGLYRPCEARVIHSILWTDGFTENNPISVSDVTIDYLCSSSVVFLPAYTSEFTYYQNENFDVYGDFVVRVSADYDNVNTVQCTALVPMYYSGENDSDCIKQLETVLSSFEQHGISPNYIYKTVVPEMESGGIIGKYADSVSRNYLSVPQNMAQQLDDFLQNQGLYEKIDSAVSDFGEWSQLSANALTRYKTAQVLCDYLRENYTYSLVAENSSSDPVMSFLCETKSGHCSLYASALTLLLRQCGIPARYCTGFAADPAQGSTITLRAKNLHAWTEVYLDQYGWVTFDPTSASLNPSPTAPTTQTSVSATTTAISEDKQPPSTSALTPSNAAQENKGGFAAVVIAAAGAAALVFAAAVVGYLLFRQKKRAQRALDALGRGDSGESSRQIYRTMVDIFSLCGLTPAKGEMPCAFFERCGKRLGISIVDKTQLLQRAAFDGADFDEEQRNALHLLLREVFAAAQRQSKLIKKISLNRLLIKNMK